VSKAKTKRLPAPKRKSGPSREQVFALVTAAVLVAVVGAFVIARVAAPSEQQASPAPTPPPTPPPLVSIPPPPTPAPSFTAAPRGPLPTSLAYVQLEQTGSVLNSIDLTTGRVRRLFRTPGAIAAPASGDNVAYPMVRTASGKEVSPSPSAQGTEVIHVRNLRTGRDVDVGEGSRPMWSWDGTRLAAYRAAGPNLTEVVAMTMQDPHLRPVTPPGSDWTIIGWAGDRLLIFGIPLRLYLAGLDGTLEQIPSPDATTRAPSPDGRWVLSVSHTGDAVFQHPGSAHPVVVDLGPWQLGASYWTENDLVFAAAATGTQLDAPSTVLVLDPANGSMLRVPDTQGAVTAFPAPDGASFVLARGKRPPTWKLWTCRLDGVCRWAGDVRIGVTPVQAG
jgi:hypothetical protein